MDHASDPLAVSADAGAASDRADEAVFVAWQARHRAHLVEVGARAGFVDCADAASLIVRLFAAADDRWHPDRDDPVLGPLLRGADERYAELRLHDFSFARRVAMTEAVRAVLAVDRAEAAP